MTDTRQEQAATYGDVVAAIAKGIRKVKRDAFADVEITEATCLWMPSGPDDVCVYLDSLDLLDLVVYLEEEHGWSVPEDDIDAEGWRTVGDLAGLVRNRMRV